MKIRSKLTKLVSDVSKDDWAKMVKRGDDRKFAIISNSETPSSAPADIVQPTPEQIKESKEFLKMGNEAFKDEKYPEALEAYEEAKKLAPSPFVEGKIKAAKEKIS